MWLEALLQDLRYAVRQFLSAPVATTVMIGMLALGIGANSALYSVMDRLIARPAPGIGDPQGMVSLTRESFSSQADRFLDTRLSYPDFLDFRTQQSVFADMAVTRLTRVGVRTGDLTTPVNAFLVSSRYFSVLRVNMTLGSGFPRTDDGNPDPNPLVVVSHRFWQQRLAAARNVIGQRIDVQGVPLTIIGVAPPMFEGHQLGDDDRDLWLPVATLPLLFPDAGAALTSRDSTHYSAIALLQPGVSTQMATAVATGTALRIAEAHPPRTPYQRLTARVQSLNVIPREMLGEAFLLMSWVGGTPIWLTLLVVCANVCGLLLARAVLRRREVAVRFALGASRVRVVRQLLTESVLLALLASAAGLLLLFWAISYFESRFPIELDVPIHWRTVAFTIVFACAVGVLFGLLPALHAVRTSVFAALKETAGLDPRGARMQRRFVIAQLTLSLPLLVAAGWYIAGSQQIAQRSLGFDAGENGLGATLNLQLRGYNQTEVDALLARAQERMAALPGVRGAAFASNVPLFSSWSSYSFRPVRAGDVQSMPNQLLRTAPGAAEDFRFFYRNAASVDPDYLRVMRIPIRRGRDIQSGDDAGAPFVAVVSEDFARTAWPGLDAIGQILITRIRRDTVWAEVTATVVGVAGSVREDPGSAPMVYVPRKQFPEATSMTLVVRSAGPAADLLATVRRELALLDPQLPLVRLVTFDRRFVERFEVERRVARYALLAGALILLIASVGVYAVIALSVAQRKREIGIRMALGARAAAVAGAFVRQGVRLGLLGLAIGVPAALILRRAFTSLFPTIGITLNTLAVLTVAAVLLVVVALASWLPARRAAAVDPVMTLRAE